MENRTWRITKEMYDKENDEGYVIGEEPYWVITEINGFGGYIFPVSEYPTKDDAWEAWRNKIM